MPNLHKQIKLCTKKPNATASKPKGALTHAEPSHTVHQMWQEVRSTLSMSIKSRPNTSIQETRRTMGSDITYWDAKDYKPRQIWLIALELIWTQKD